MYLTKSRSMANYAFSFTVHSPPYIWETAIIRPYYISATFERTPLLLLFFFFFTYCFYQNVFLGGIPVVLGVHTWFIILILPFWLLDSYLSRQRHL